MNPLKSITFLKYTLWCFLILGFVVFMNPPAVQANAMPEFTQTSQDKWINSPPLTKADVKGKVVLLEIWTSI